MSVKKRRGVAGLAKRIAASNTAAIQRLKITGPELKRARALHAELFACDLFGFLPVTWSPKACATLLEMADKGASHAEMRPVRESICRATSVFNPGCRREFCGAISATGLNCTILTVGSEKSLHHSLHRISWYIQMFDYLAPWLKKAVCVEDIAAARAARKLAVVCSANCPPAQSGLEDGMDAHNWIETFHRLGIRVMHLTYNRRNWVGDGCLEPADAGLSLHGRDVVAQLNQLGIIVDTPHSGERTTIAAAKASRVPMMASHTFCRALHDHPRGKSDDALNAVADSGGLVGICALPNFLGRSGDLKALMEHVDYAVNLIGADHVAIGTDAAYQGDFPARGGLAAFERKMPKAGAYSADKWFGAWEPRHLATVRPSESARASLAWINWPFYTAGLMKMGYDRATIAKILGGNFLRVFKAVQRHAAVPV